MPIQLQIRFSSGSRGPVWLRAGPLEVQAFPVDRPSILLAVHRISHSPGEPHEIDEISSLVRTIASRPDRVQVFQVDRDPPVFAFMADPEDMADLLIMESDPGCRYVSWAG